MICTDRSRFITQFVCPFKRFAAYHYNGVGITKTDLSIPLATGSHVHTAIEAVLRLAVQTEDLPKSEDVRYIIDEVNRAYKQEVAESGFTNEESLERVQHIRDEQTTLLSGLVWSWSGFILPMFIEEYEILHIEQEMERILGCGCGLTGLGNVQDHVSRDCKGLMLMSRPDVVAHKRSTAENEVTYIEIKTGGKIDSGTFEGDVQFAFGAAAVESFTGKEMSASYVHALNKGYRKAEYNPENKQYDGPPYQASSLCYAYVREGISGMTSQDVKFKYGTGVTKQHKRTPVWQVNFDNAPKGIPPIEHYISMMSDEDLASHVAVLGPYPYPKSQVEDSLEDMYHSEKQCAEAYHYCDDIASKYGLGNDLTRHVLHEYAPRSWNCRTYGSICEFYPICARQAGCDEPLSMKGKFGKPMYVKRTPNHPIESESTQIE